VRTIVAVTALLVLGSACKHDPGTFISVEDWAEPTPVNDGEYIIRAGDLLNIRVFQQENMSARGRVRVDGKISLPFLNDVAAAGYTPVVLSKQLEGRLKDFINNPIVTISLEEVRPLSISVLGEVPRPGIYQLEAGGGVLQALAAAGGFTNFARQDLFVVRVNRDADKPQRIRFDYDVLARAEGKGPGFRLKAADVLIVE
jgi:polysaccharide export outer membrane protein